MESNGNGNGNGNAPNLHSPSEKPQDAAQCVCAEEPAEFGIRQLKRLFHEQQQYLDYFFKHLNYDEVTTGLLP